MVKPAIHPRETLPRTTIARRSWWWLGYAPRRVVDVEQPASGLDPALILRFRDEFVRTSRWHRWRSIAGVFATFAGFLASMTVFFMLSFQAVSFGLIDSASIEAELLLFVALLVGVASALATQSRLGARCPHCRCSVDDLGRFCPLCGDRSLTLKPKPHCTSCASELRWDWLMRSHEREYRVHHCSACGLSICPDGFP